MLHREKRSLCTAAFPQACAGAGAREVLCPAAFPALSRGSLSAPPVSFRLPVLRPSLRFPFSLPGSLVPPVYGARSPHRKAAARRPRPMHGGLTLLADFPLFPLSAPEKTPFRPCLPCIFSAPQPCKTPFLIFLKKR